MGDDVKLDMTNPEAETAVAETLPYDGELSKVPSGRVLSQTAFSTDSVVEAEPLKSNPKLLAERPPSLDEEGNPLYFEPYGDEEGGGRRRKARREEDDEVDDMADAPTWTAQMTVDCVIVFFFIFPLVIINHVATPVKKGFYCNDDSINLPYKPDSISKAVLLLSGLGIPFLVIVVTESIRVAFRFVPGRHMLARLPFKIAKAYGVFLFGIIAVCYLTEMLKFSVGRLRPHFLSVCRPHYQVNCSTAVWPERKLVEHYECSQINADPKLQRDSHLSFPSGHATVSVYSALFTVFYLQLRMTPSFSYLLRPLVQLTLLACAIYCCVTRFTDNKHFVSDIAFGAGLGALLAWLTFYKLAARVLPECPPKGRPGVSRGMSEESEPYTPTPLLQSAPYTQTNTPKGPKSAINTPKAAGTGVNTPKWKSEPTSGVPSQFEPEVEVDRPPEGAAGFDPTNFNSYMTRRSTKEFTSGELVVQPET